MQHVHVNKTWEQQIGTRPLGGGGGLFFFLSLSLVQRFLPNPSPSVNSRPILFIYLFFAAAETTTRTVWYVSLTSETAGFIRAKVRPNSSSLTASTSLLPGDALLATIAELAYCPPFTEGMSTA